MISLKSLAKYVREAKITAPKKGKETPLDAKVQIPGYGVMIRKQMQGLLLLSQYMYWGMHVGWMKWFRFARNVIFL